MQKALLLLALLFNIKSSQASLQKGTTPYMPPEKGHCISNKSVFFGYNDQYGGFGSDEFWKEEKKEYEKVIQEDLLLSGYVRRYVHGEGKWKKFISAYLSSDKWVEKLWCYIFLEIPIDDDKAGAYRNTLQRLQCKYPTILDTKISIGKYSHVTALQLACRQAKPKVVKIIVKLQGNRDKPNSEKNQMFIETLRKYQSFLYTDSVVPCYKRRQGVLKRLLPSTQPKSIEKELKDALEKYTPEKIHHRIYGTEIIYILMQQFLKNYEKEKGSRNLRNMLECYTLFSEKAFRNKTINKKDFDKGKVRQYLKDLRVYIDRVIKAPELVDNIHKKNEDGDTPLMYMLKQYKGLKQSKLAGGNHMGTHLGHMYRAIYPVLINNSNLKLLDKKRKTPLKILLDLYTTENTHHYIKELIKDVIVLYDPKSINEALRILEEKSKNAATSDIKFFIRKLRWIDKIKQAEKHKNDPVYNAEENNLIYNAEEYHFNVSNSNPKSINKALEEYKKLLDENPPSNLSKERARTLDTCMKDLVKKSNQQSIIKGLMLVLKLYNPVIESHKVFCGGLIRVLIGGAQRESIEPPFICALKEYQASVNEGLSGERCLQYMEDMIDPFLQEADPMLINEAFRTALNLYEPSINNNKLHWSTVIRRFVSTYVPNPDDNKLDKFLYNAFNRYETLESSKPLGDDTKRFMQKIIGDLVKVYDEAAEKRGKKSVLAIAASKYSPQKKYWGSLLRLLIEEVSSKEKINEALQILEKKAQKEAEEASKNNAPEVYKKHIAKAYTELMGALGNRKKQLEENNEGK